LEVDPRINRPHYLKSKSLEKGTYIRIGSTNRLADTAIINELQRLARLETYDEQPLGDLSSEAIDFRAASELFLEYRKLKKSDLETLKLTTKHQGREVPTVGGVVLFGKERGKYFPDAWIQAGRFIGKDKQDILDTQEIHAYPVIAVEEAFKFVQKHMMRGVEIKGTRGHEKWTIPLVAIREAIISAIVHADYSQRGSPIRLSVFSDRIEIENPGLIPFNLTLDDLYRGISKLRNPVIGRVFHELKLIERWGSGITRMVEATLNAGLERPLLEEVGTHFRVTFFSTPSKTITRPKRDETDLIIINLLKNHEGLSTQQIANKITLSTRATRTRLINLVESGLVVKIGSDPRDPKKKYYLIK